MKINNPVELKGGPNVTGRPLDAVAKASTRTGWSTPTLRKKTRSWKEWINEIPTVPIYYLAKPQPRERAWQNQRGKKTLLSLTLV
ncbi:hypothetical protein FIBSPDRAFT_771347 [Athelia psychrophila]|uniref:Uncharacterized protein n=1 Tax=Athelia psychrophila TaxID=1759441 RepID=A0A167SKX1_9AGAM|nr:hypothetical protein FIBSPDRAFT_771347 [Fibularhizoctonia sp. CBS 109695]